VRLAFTDAVKRLRRSLGDRESYAANWIEATLYKLLDGEEDPG
jgi:hypothetical protein